MTEYRFGGSLYFSEREFYQGVVDHWLSAGGINTSTDILEILASSTDQDLANEIFNNWGEEENLNLDDLVRAVSEVRRSYEEDVK